MRNLIAYSITFLLLVSCSEELISKPENLIPQEKMADLIQEMAIVNAAKSTNTEIFRQNNIDPTRYVLAKFNVDSLQYVESDRYYVSKPAEYEKIFKIVEKRLEVDAKAMSETKRKQDSTRLQKQRDEAKMQLDLKKAKNDSLP